MATPSFKFRVDDTLGAASIGFAFSCVAFGILTAQVYTYFRRYPSDRPVYHVLVSLYCLAQYCFLNNPRHRSQRYGMGGSAVSRTCLMNIPRLLEVVDQAFIGHAVYFYTITYAQTLLLRLSVVDNARLAETSQVP